MLLLLLLRRDAQHHDCPRVGASVQLADAVRRRGERAPVRSTRREVDCHNHVVVLRLILQRAR